MYRNLKHAAAGAAFSVVLACGAVMLSGCGVSQGSSMDAGRSVATIRLDFRIGATRDDRLDLSDYPIDADPAAAAAAEFRWFRLRDGVQAPRGCISTEKDGATYLLLSNRPDQVMLSGPDKRDWSLVSVARSVDTSGRPMITFNLDEVGAGYMEILTAENLYSPMAILLDDVVYSAPHIMTILSHSGCITGDFTADEQREIIDSLKAGQ